MAPFDTTSYWSAIVFVFNVEECCDFERQLKITVNNTLIYRSHSTPWPCLILFPRYSTSNNGLPLNSVLGIIQCY